MTTKAFRFEGHRLFVNAEATGGTVAVALLDEKGKLMAGFDRLSCDVLKETDPLEWEVSWNGRSDLASLAGRPSRLRFYLQNARLFSFRFGNQ